MTALLVALLVLVLALVVPTGVIAGRAARRQVLLYRLQKWAAWNWEMDREYRRARGLDGLRSFRAQAEHLDRHVRLAREERRREH